ncbi:hypothetical protein SAMN03159422_00796 [Agrobacterium fabrum]|nr:hypothetical protein [Agrobacterium fabrum]SDB25120.1 hypothetical protein SAMN03159422_00796 [Agrobacterium fabrum]SEQ47486.1 hypothetical protein SAMN03159504_00797 [Agrobacterium fabrum]
MMEIGGSGSELVLLIDDSSALLLIPVLVTGIQPAQVLGLKRVSPPRRRASAGFL